MLLDEYSIWWDTIPHTENPATARQTQLVSPKLITTTNANGDLHKVPRCQNFHLMAVMRQLSWGICHCCCQFSISHSIFLLLQIAKGNFTYNYGDYGNIIVMLEPRKPTKTLLWVVPQALHNIKCAMSGLHTTSVCDVQGLITSFFQPSSQMVTIFFFSYAWKFCFQMVFGSQSRARK